MSKKRLANGRDKHPGRYLQLFKYMMDSPAWCDLKPTERALYVELARRYAGPGSNNGRIYFSIRDAAEALHVGKTTAAEAFKSLQEHGFIVCMQLGAFSLKVRHATEWRLTEYACDVTGALASKDFMRWVPENKSRYPSADRTVPEGGQVGTCRRTVGGKNALYGT